MRFEGASKRRLNGLWWVEVAMALTILYGMDLGIRLDRLTELSQLVQKISGIPSQPYKPIVGENIFVHNTDSHIVSEIKGIDFVGLPVVGHDKTGEVVTNRIVK